MVLVINIIQEFLEEKEESEDDTITESIQNARNKLDNLGMTTKQEGKESYIWEKNYKRGKESLAELITIIGRDENQRKNIGKGKNLIMEL